MVCAKHFKAKPFNNVYSIIINKFVFLMLFSKGYLKIEKEIIFIFFYCVIETHVKDQEKLVWKDLLLLLVLVLATQSHVSLLHVSINLWKYRKCLPLLKSNSQYHDAVAYIAFSYWWAKLRTPRQSACKGAHQTVLFLKIMMKSRFILCKRKHWIFLIEDSLWILVPSSKLKAPFGIFLYIN